MNRPIWRAISGMFRGANWMRPRSTRKRISAEPRFLSGKAIIPYRDEPSPVLSRFYAAGSQRSRLFPASQEVLRYRGCRGSTTEGTRVKPEPKDAILAQVFRSREHQFERSRKIH